jgi:NADH dehydrogenase FAD-containing subunit
MMNLITTPSNALTNQSARIEITQDNVNAIPKKRKTVTVKPNFFARWVGEGGPRRSR